MLLSPSLAPAGTPSGVGRAVARTPPADPARFALRLLMLFALYAIPVIVTLRPVGVPVYDPDVWWHLRVGQWVVDHGTVPHTDPFSQVGRPWVAYSWLYEVLLYKLYVAFGLAGIVVYRVALALALVASLHRLVARREPRFLVATGLTAAGVLACAPLFGERPWLVTVLGTTLTLHAVLDVRAGNRSWLVWLLPPLFVVWANCHIQFVYGLLVLGLACVAPLIDSALGLGRPDETAATARTRPWGLLVALSVICFLATLATPYHLRLYGVLLEYATQPGAFRWVNELKALEFREAPDFVMAGLVGAALFFLGRRRGLSSFDVLLVAGTSFLALRARRDLWFAALAALAVLSAGPGADPAEARFAPGRRVWAFVPLGLAVLVALLAWDRQLTPANLGAKVASVFPAEAVEHVKRRGYAGPLYNDFNWGGYLIWALPDLPVAIDGRTNLHGDARMARFGQTWSGLPGWQDDPDLSAAGVVIAPADSPLVSLLALDKRFRLAHRDPVACVFVRRGGR
jgi:hypothetical protein